MENQIEKVFVKVNQVWHKGEAISKNETTYKVRISNHPDFTHPKESDLLELQEFPKQKFAFAEVKERMEGAYISFDKLPDNIQESLVKGEEYLHRSSYIQNGELRENTKMVQMLYQRNTGSKLDVQIKRKEKVTPEEAKAYNYHFTAAEYTQMVDEGKVVAFTGTSTTGEQFTKLAYYEPRLNDIRAKAALSEHTYFYGQTLTKAQADAINKGQETEISIATKRGRKTYLVTYSPKAERFVTKSVHPSKMNAMASIPKTVKETVKKKTKGQTVSL